VSGETAWRVPSLPVPDDDADNAADAMASASVQLFAARATAVDPSFSLGGDERRHVFAICRRLDGIPLAIELAAARCAVIEVAELAERLEHSFRILTGGSRSALPRQQTLDATIDWSYQLLSDDERDLLCRIAVFRGGASLEAVEAVAGDDTLDRLSALVGKSLIVRERAAGRARYRLLEPVRQFALARLSERGIGTDARDRHLQHFVGFARDVLHAYEHAQLSAGARRRSSSSSTTSWPPRSGATPTATTRTRAGSPSASGTSSSTSGGSMWPAVSASPLSKRPTCPPGCARWCSHRTLIYVDTEADLRALIEEGERIAPDEDHRARLQLSMVNPLLGLGGDVDEARRYIEEAGPALRASGARGLIARHKVFHAFVLIRAGELERARELLEDVLETDGILSGLQTYARYLCGVVAETAGDDDRAAACYQAVIDEGQEQAVGTSFSHMRLSSLCRQRGEMDTALEHARTALRLERTRGTVGNRSPAHRAGARRAVGARSGRPDHRRGPPRPGVRARPPLRHRLHAQLPVRRSGADPRPGRRPRRRAGRPRPDWRSGCRSTGILRATGSRASSTRSSASQQHGSASLFPDRAVAEASTRLGGAVAAIRTPDQRPRVFVSSTLGELAHERAVVREAIEALHLTPVMAGLKEPGDGREAPLAAPLERIDCV
jgi:predicted ATPase